MKHQKRKFAGRFLTAVLLAAGLLAGCAGSSRTEEAAVPEYVFTYAENQAYDYPTAQGARRFAELVKERTNGRIVINVYNDSELGDEPSVIEQLKFGGIDFARVSIMSLADQVEILNVLQLPYLYANSDHMWRVLDGEIGDELLAELQGTGMVGLSWYDAGARNFYNQVRPIAAPEDLAGLRIRVAQSQMMYDMVYALGTAPVTIGFDEVYSALETGTIDGAENNCPSYASKKHWEVAPYITLDAHNRIPELQLCAQSTWECLNEEDRQILQDCARESALYERTLWAEAETDARAWLKANGCLVTELTNQELTSFREAVQPLYNTYAADYEKLLVRIAAMAEE